MVDFFSNPSALLEKVKYDFSQIEMNEINKNLIRSEKMNWYSIFNSLVGINHLFDWVMNNEKFGELCKRECVKKFNGYYPYDKIPGNFKKYYDKTNFPPINNNQKIIRGICNNLKHYKIRENTPDIVEKKLYFGCGNINMVCGNSKAVCGYYDEYRFILYDKENNDVNVYNVLQQAISEWDVFLTKYACEFEGQTPELIP